MLTEEDEPEVKYISSMHGDEIVGAMLCMNLADWLMANYGVDPQATNIVNNVELWLVPLMNPDGYDQSPRTRYNGQGYDLNRTFPEWTTGDPQHPVRPPDRSAGDHELVVRALRSHCSVNFHGGEMVVNYPFDIDTGVPNYTYAPSPDDDDCSSG